MRKMNFYAGPSTLPVEVLERMKNEIFDYEGNGLSMVETSHRSKMFDQMYEKCLSLIREIYQIPDDFDVFFLGGGATLQFSMIPNAFLRNRADYLLSGIWSKKAYNDAKKFGDVNLYFDDTENKYTHLPDPEKVKPSENSDYLYLCSNETVGGIQWQQFPSFSQDVPLIADMSSDFFTRPVPFERFGMVYGGIQKNLGPAGATLIIIRRDMYQRMRENLSLYMDYKAHGSKNGLLNTPSVFSIWGVEMVMEWIKENGGIPAMERRAKEKSAMIYSVIDSSEFWHSPVDPAVRSRMNVVFTLGDPRLEALFVEESEKAGMVGLKGHRSVGGLRASLYNACPMDDVKALASFMKEFERTHG